MAESANKIDADKKAQNVEIITAKLKEIVIPDYIQESLDKVARAEGFRNFEVKIDHGSSIGDGFSGLIMKAKIQEHDSEKSLTALVKFPPQNEMRRQMFNSMPIFKREVYIYNIFLPELVKFQEEHGISQEKGFFNFPKVYFAEYSEERNDAIIIMEDLREKNLRMWNKYKPMNFEHAKLVVATLGRLHGLSLAMKIKKPEQFEKFKELDDVFLGMGGENFPIVQYMQDCLLTAINFLDPSDVERKEKAMKLLDGFMEKYRLCIDGSAAEPFSVMIHGDCWTNNFLFDYREQQSVPEGITLIDWQNTRYCSPVLDLVYFIFISTDHELRTKHWDELINIYHSSLVEIVKSLGSDITQPSIADLLNQLRKFGKFGVIMGATVMPTVLVKKDVALDLDFVAEVKMSKENSALQEELDKKIQEEKVEYTVRLREIVEDAIDYGYL